MRLTKESFQNFHDRVCHCLDRSVDLVDWTLKTMSNCNYCNFKEKKELDQSTK